jgi:hypothetical protein
MRSKRVVQSKGPLMRGDRTLVADGSPFSCTTFNVNNRASNPKRAWSFKSLHNPSCYWWAARVSIPAPWDSSQIVHARPSLSACPGQRLPWIRQRPLMSFRVCFPGYMIGYTTSEVGWRTLFKFVVLMTSKLRSVSRGQLVETATTKAARTIRI